MLEYHERPLVYVAGPYVKPDPVENTHRTIRAADELTQSGHVTAFVPHLTLLWHAVIPREPDFWYAYDLAILVRADALLRLPGESTGSDNEEKFAMDNGIPVFYTTEELLAWAEARAGE